MLGGLLAMPLLRPWKLKVLKDLKLTKATVATSSKGTDHKTNAFNMEAFAKSDPEGFREYLKKPEQQHQL